ncbi:MAG TPA: GspE/PulE family protein [Burkholderiaceae bacterium]|nr:GspE/PulE family protein [Burkholderiaceae bacterium]
MNDVVRPSGVMLSVDDVLRIRARAANNSVLAAVAEHVGCDEREAARTLAAILNLSAVETADLQRYRPAFTRIALPKAQARRCVLLHANDDEANGFLAAVCDPLDDELIAWLEHAAEAPVTLVVASDADITAYLNQHENAAKAADAWSASEVTPEASHSNAEVLSLAALSETLSPAVRLVNSTLYDALKTGASDIHLESTSSGLAIKHRIDGVLDTPTLVHGTTLAEQAISRIKVLAELDIAERRIPQDGSFRVRVQERDIDLRVSIMPSVHGEDAVIRVLDKQAVIERHGKLTLEALGFDPTSLATLRELAEAPYGMLLVTGPTGSGKTTTLYAALSETNTGRDKIITIEDPVEYQLPGVLQIPVNDKKGLTFARGLRSILRHDPDKIMVGEIRDRETAEIAVQSALTGHFVLTTVHANNVFDVFGRFTHMGLDPYAFASALNGIWAQRLVRVNCPHCNEPYTPERDELHRVGLDERALQDMNFRRGRGCGDCRGTGYRGRHAIAEILRLDDELRELIVERQPVRRIKELARARGTRSLHDAALDLARAGMTTLHEVRRVALAA